MSGWDADTVNKKAKRKRWKIMVTVRWHKRTSNKGKEFSVKEHQRRVAEARGHLQRVEEILKDMILEHETGVAPLAAEIEEKKFEYEGAKAELEEIEREALDDDTYYLGLKPEESDTWEIKAMSKSRDKIDEYAAELETFLEEQADRTSETFTLRGSDIKNKGLKVELVELGEYQD